MDYRNFVGGQWLETSDSTPNVNPSDISDILGHAAKAGVDQLDQAVGAAHQAAPAGRRRRRSNVSTCWISSGRNFWPARPN